MPPKRKSTSEVSVTPKVPKRSGPVPDTKYKKEDLVLCKYGEVFYEAKILEIDPVDGYFIHYQGWNKRYDGFIKFEDSGERFKEYSPDAVKEAKDAKKVVKTPSKAKTPKSTPKTAPKSQSTSSRPSHDKEAPEVKPSTQTPKLKLGFRTQDKNKQETSSASEKKPVEPKSEPVGSSHLSPKSPKKITVPKPELNKVLTPEFADVLMEDNEMITRKYKLPKVPADRTVRQIVKEFCDSRNIKLPAAGKMLDLNSEKNMVEPSLFEDADCFDGVLSVFDACVSLTLIYPFEREHLDEVSAKENEPDKGDVLRLSHYLGVTYLLRMLTRIYDILNIYGMSEERARLVIRNCEELSKFVVARIDDYFDPAAYYVQPAADYIRRNTKAVV